VRDTTVKGEGNYISGFQGSHAMPTSPSGWGNTFWNIWRRNGCNIVKFGTTLKAKFWSCQCEASSATWHSDTNTASALGPRKVVEKLDRFGRSQQLPEANWFLDSTPTLNTRTLILFPIGVKSQGHFTADSQSVRLGVEPTLWTLDQILLPFQEFRSGIYCPVSVRRPLWWEAGSVLCKSV
jgi:hypothetical protein